MKKILETKNYVVEVGFRPRSDLADWIVPAAAVFEISGRQAENALILAGASLINRLVQVRRKTSDD